MALLKFRVWHRELSMMMPIKNMWFQDNILEELELNNAVANDYIIAYPDEIELMQSTGLKDKNGKEIFEGDILGTKDGLLNGVVNFNTDLGMWTNSLIRYNNFERLYSVANSREIIGNIWEDGELLDVENTEENRR